MTKYDSQVSVSYFDLLTDPRLGLILLVTAVGMIGSLLPPALPALVSGLSVGDETVGYIITFYKIPSILIIPIAAVIADIYGRRAVLIPSLIIFGAAGSLMFFIRSFSMMLFLALFLGIGAAAIYPITVTLLGDYFQDEQNSAGQGIRVGVIGIGAILIPAITGYLAGIQWNYPFLLFFCAFPVIVIVFVFLKEPIQQTTSKDNSILIGNYIQSIRKELTDSALGILLFGGFIRGFSRYALITFVPLFAVSSLSASLFEVGLLLSARGVVYLIVAPFAGELVNRFARKWILVGSLSASGLAFIFLSSAPGLFWLGLLVGFHAIGDAMFDPVNKGTVTAVAHGEYRAGIVNTLYVLKRIGQTFAPMVFGLILTIYNYHTLFVSAGIVIFAYLLIFSFVFNYKPTST